MFSRACTGHTFSRACHAIGYTFSHNRHREAFSRAFGTSHILSLFVTLFSQPCVLCTISDRSGLYIFFPLVLVGSLKKDQNMLAKNVEGLKKVIDDAVVKVKV